MISIDWYGPYKSIDEAREAAVNDYDDALYMAMGKLPYQRAIKIQYIGIGSVVHRRMKDSHHKLSKITKDIEIWLGEVSTAEPAGKRRKFTKTTLDFAEWLHVRFMQLPLNEKKKIDLPNRSVTVLNRWYGRDYESPKKRPHKDWPDLIDFPLYDEPAKIVWFGKKQKLFKSPEYMA